VLHDLRPLVLEPAAAAAEDAPAMSSAVLSMSEVVVRGACLCWEQCQGRRGSRSVSAVSVRQRPCARGALVSTWSWVTSRGVSVVEFGVETIQPGGSRSKIYTRRGNSRAGRLGGTPFSYRMGRI
jgi:hypothetical protein